MPMLKEETAKILKDKQRKTLEVEKEKLENLKKVKETENLVPSITEENLAATANAKTKQSRGEILRRYAKNTAELNLKERRVVFSKVQAMRAMQAKEVFLKELAAIGKQLEKQKDTAAVDFEARKA